MTHDLDTDFVRSRWHMISGALAIALLSFGKGACTPDVDPNDDAGTGGSAGTSTGGQATGGGATVGGGGGQGGAGDACLRSGGIVVTKLCCESVGDFPNLCVTGGCGCAPSSSHDVLTCECPASMCFDGKVCAVDPRRVYATTDAGDHCVAAGNVTLTLHNASAATLYLPGCEEYSIKNGSTYTPNAVCVWEGIARPVPAGTNYVATDQYQCPDVSGSTTLCFQVGLGCTVADVPLSEANCASLEWVCAPSFAIWPTP